MAAKLVNNVKIAILNTGTGALQLGSAIEGYRGVEALTNGEVYSYSIRQNAAFEYGRGTYLASGQQLLRQPGFSSDGGPAINLQPGAQVSFVALAEDITSPPSLYPLSGEGPPQNEIGDVGQFYRDIASDAQLEYGPKTDTGWGLPRPLAGRPGGSNATYASLADLSGQTVPDGTDLIWIADQAESYIRDAAVNSDYLAANPETSGLDAAGQGFRRADPLRNELLPTTPQEFGGTTETSITSAKVAARSRRSTLRFGGAVYTSGKIVLDSGLDALHFDRGVEINSTATDVAIALDGLAAVDTNGIFGGQFGIGSAPRLYAPDASAGVLLRRWHHGYARAESMGCTGDAFRINYAVCSVLEPIVSINRQPDGAWASGRPVNGVLIQSADGLGRTTAQVLWNPIIEGVSGYGVLNADGDHILSIGGTSEGNSGTGGGWADAPGATYSYVLGLFCEGNGTYDFYLAGFAGSFVGCVGNFRVEGARYVIDKAQATQITVTSSAEGTVIRDTTILSRALGVANGLTDSGKGTVFENVAIAHATGATPLPDRRPRPKEKLAGPRSIAGLSLSGTQITLTIAAHGLDWGEVIAIAASGGMAGLNGNSYAVEPLTDDTVRLMNAAATAYADGTGMTYTAGGTATLLALNSTWVSAAGDGYGDPGFSITAEGLVVLQGAVKGQTGSAYVFQLPPGARPRQQQSVRALNVSTNGALGAIIQSGGAVFINTTVLTTDIISLSGIAFMARQ